MNIYFLFISLEVLSGVVRGAVRHKGTSKVRDIFDPLKIMRTFVMPKSCKDEGRKFCFDNDNYPTDIVKDLFQNVTGLVVAPKNDFPDDYDSYEVRGGSPFTYDCHATSQNNIIYYIVDEAGTDRVVVQLEGRFQQDFSVKMCEQEGPISGRTDHFMKHVVKQHKMYCQNKYLHYEFMVLSTEPGVDGKWKIEKARTGIPVCCMCRYDKKF